MKNQYAIRTASLILYFFIIIGLGACQQTGIPRASKGELTLSEAQFQKYSSMELSGEWEFYWEQLLTPEDFKDSAKKEFNLIKVPGSWGSQKNMAGETYPVYGHATYHLQVDLPKNITTIGILIPKIWSSSKIWINGEILLERGKVSEKMGSGYENQIVEKLLKVPLNQPKLDIIIQVSSFDNLVSGLVQPIFIGNYDRMEERRDLMNGVDMMWLGCLLLMSVYHFILYIFRKKNTSTLYFGIACLLIASRILVFGEHYFHEFLKEGDNILQLNLYSVYQFKIYYISSFILIPIALSYIRSLYPDESNLIVIRVCALILGIYCIILIVLPPHITAPTITIFEVIAVIFELYLLYVLLMAIIRKRKDAILQMLGILFMIFASVNDTLHGEEIDLVGSIELTPGAFAIFLSMQFFIIAKRFSNAFTEVEDLSENLEQKVEERTLELNEANHELVQTLDTLHKAKREIEDKNKEITDSITYAQRIQQAILPLAENFNQALSGCFVLFKPRDIVSGDFYYLEEVKGKIIVAAIDCTGHGVPGAFMSMLGKEILDNVILEREIIEADKILNELHKGIRQVLKQKASSNRDGMDLSLLVIDKTNNTIEYAGAKNALIYVQDGELVEIKADKMSIGGEQQEEERIFTKHHIEIKPNTTFYLFTDGYQDQFGGPEGRKFMIKRLREIILNINQRPMKDQKLILNQRIEQWMKEGSERQIDDILVMGIRV